MGWGVVMVVVDVFGESGVSDQCGISCYCDSVSGDLLVFIFLFFMNEVGRTGDVWGGGGGGGGVVGGGGGVEGWGGGGGVGCGGGGWGWVLGVGGRGRW